MSCTGMQTYYTYAAFKGIPLQQIEPPRALIIEAFIIKSFRKVGGNQMGGDDGSLGENPRPLTPYGGRCHPFVWHLTLFVLGALGASAWVSMLQAS
jgi:hypothetical protein